MGSKQPSTHSSIPAEWVAEFDGSSAAARVEQLNADLDLVGDLRIEGFKGRLWDKLAWILASYGFQVITTWTRRGTIFEKCGQKGYGRFLSSTPRVEVSALDADDIAQRTLFAALEHFRTDVLIPGVWDPRRGASLKTFFIGQCLMRFPSAYRAWYNDEHRKRSRERRSWRKVYVLDAAKVEDIGVGEEVVRLQAGFPNPEARLIRKDEMNEARATIRDKKLLEILELRASDYDYDEIAELVGLSVPAIKSKVHRHMKRMAKDGVA